MPSLPFFRLALVLSLFGGSAYAGPASLANSWRSEPVPQRNWVEVQREWAEQSHRQTQRRLDRLDQCLSRARQRWEYDQCLRRDDLAREWQWQRDQQRWQTLVQQYVPQAQARTPW